MRFGTAAAAELTRPQARRAIPKRGRSGLGLQTGAGPSVCDVAESNQRDLQRFVLPRPVPVQMQRPWANRHWQFAICAPDGTVRAPRFPTRTRRFAGIRVNFLAPDFWCRAIRTPACASTLCALAPSRKVVCCTGERRFAGMQPGGAGQKPAGQSSLRRDHGPLGERRPAACRSESTGARGPLGSGRDSKLRPGGASLRNLPAAAAGRLRESALSRKRRRRAFGAAPPPMGAEADTSSHHD
jgi:hypothetical protein